MGKNWRKKRLSTLLLLGMVVFFILAYIALIGVTRAGIKWSLSGGQNVTGSTRFSDDSGEVLYPYKDFDSIEVDGLWDISVEYGTEYTVYVDMGEKKPAKTKVTRNGSLLVMKNPDPERTLAAIVVLPRLEKVIVSGDAQIRLEGFEGEILNADLTDRTRLITDRCRFGTVVLRAAKNASADFSGTAATHGEVSLSGDSRSTLNLEGGTLSGRVNGTAELRLEGSVTSESLQVGSKARVVR